MAGMYQNGKNEMWQSPDQSEIQDKATRSPVSGSCCRSRGDLMTETTYFY